MPGEAGPGVENEFSPQKKKFFKKKKKF